MSEMYGESVAVVQDPAPAPAPAVPSSMSDQVAAAAAVAAAPAPGDVNGVAKAVVDLKAHLDARLAQHPILKAEFDEVVRLVQGIESRGTISHVEGQLVQALVHRLAGNRLHLELGYLIDLADNLVAQVLKGLVAA